MNEFLSMGGYGAYVWTAYGIALAIVVWNLWVPHRARRTALRAARLRRERGRL